MNLQQTVSRILGIEVSIEEAKDFANNQYGVLCQFNREWEQEASNKKETLVYMVGFYLDEYEPSMTDEEFMDLAEEKGSVYSLKGFEDAFNEEEINSSIEAIRFITI